MKTLAIVRGNDFFLKIPLEQITPSGKENITADYIPSSPTACLVDKTGRKTRMEVSVTGNVLSFRVNGNELKNSSYSIEITDVKEGRNLRSFQRHAFRIVESNEQSSYPEGTEFGVSFYIINARPFAVN